MTPEQPDDGGPALNAILKLNRALATSEEVAWDAGYRSVIEGPNERNCHFKWFRSPEMTAHWEAGQIAARKAGTE